MRHCDNLIITPCCFTTLPPPFAGDELLENHVDLASLSPERRAKVEEELKKELDKVSPSQIKIELF